MKAKFLALAALLVGMAACQTDPNGLELDRNGEAAVSVSVALPEGATRAAGTNSALGAIGNVNMNEYDIRFILEVYDENGVLAKDRLVKTTDESATNFDLRLVPGRAYNFVAWADFVENGREDDLYYNTNVTEGEKNFGLRKVQIIDDKWDAIIEARDAYTDVCTVHNFTSTSTIDMTLTRPFAKLRVVTNDITEMITLRPKSVTVNYFNTKFYTSFDAFTETASGEMEKKNLVVTLLDDQMNPGDVYTDGLDKDAAQQTLFADYFFGAEDDRVMFTMDVEFNDKSTLPQPVVFNTNIPVKRNNLTTVYGPILTDANNVTVKIEEGFAGNINVGRYDTANKTLAEVLAEAASKDVEATIELAGNVEWTTGAGHGSTPLMDENAKTEVLTINGNGHTLTAIGSGVGAIRMANGGKVIFNNVKVVDKSVSYNETAWELCYLEFGGALEFNNCEFVNAIQLEEANATFNNCSFNSHKDNEYAVWVCGNKAYFNECTFEGPRGLKVHEDYGSEVEEVVVDKTTFNNITKKPGIALGTLNNDTTITIKNSTFNNCQAGDQGLYIYETDTDVTTFDFTEENNAVKVAVATAEDFAKMLKFNTGKIEVVLNADIECPISSLGQQTGGSGEYKLGGENTEAITIDLGGKKLNITTTYWSGIGAKNDNALFTIKNGTMTSSQATGTWNSYDVTFANCNYAIEDVTFEKAIAFTNAEKTVTIKNVTINETHDYYAMWISAKGQTVNINNLTINSDGRGIKIDEQYVSAPAKVTMNINGAEFTTANKAAILVKNVAGAEITLANIDITKVYADTYHAVWVDEDSAAYADLVTVNGGNKMVEGDSAVAIVRNNDAMSTAIANGATKVILAAGEYTMPAVNGKTVTIIGSKDTVINLGATNTGSGSVTLEGVTVKAGQYKGFQHSNVITYNNVTIEGELFCYATKDIFNNCTFNLNNGYVWTYGSKETLFENCTFNTNGKAILVYNEGAGASNVTVKGCTFNASAKAYAGAIKNQNCAAIEIDNHQNSGVGAAHKVTASENTYGENFSGEWRIKNYVAGAAITVNGTEYNTIALDGKAMTIDADKNVTILQ